MQNVFKKMLLSVLMVTMTLTVISNNVWSAQDKPIKLLFGTFDPPNALFSQVHKRWAKELEERTGGRVKVELSFGFSQPGEIYHLTKKGLLDVGPCIPGFNPGQFPFAEIVGLPFIIPAAEIGTRAMVEFVNRGYKDPAFNDVKTLFYFTCSADSIFTRSRAVAKVDDLNGLKIHAGGPQIAQRVKLMGGVPTFIHYPELYGSFEKGIIDGLVMGYAIMEIFRLYEVTKYVVEPAVGTGAVVHVMNKKKWNQLPTDIQQTIDELSKKYCIENARAWDAGCKRGKKLFLDGGGQVNELDAAEIDKANKLIQPMWTEWISATEKKGLPGKKAIDDMCAILKGLGVDNPAIGYATDH
jgi:TRAP-type C4-dicarboxylate transport system substrate-binding protein